MKVCFITTSFDGQYGGQQVYALTKGLAEKGIELNVVVPSSPTSNSFEVKDRIRIHRFQYFSPKKLQRLTSEDSILNQFKKSFLAKIQFPFFILSFIFKTIKIAKKSDVIHANWTLTGIPGIIAKKIYKKPLILSIHGSGIRSMPKFINKWVLKNTDYIISSTPEQDEILRKLGWKKEIYDIKNISDTKKFEKKVDTKEFKKSLGLKNEPLITFIARLENFKNPLTFIKSVPLVLKDNPKVKFVIAGDGPLKTKLITFVKANNLQKNVFILGKRTDVNVILQASTIFTALSHISNLFSGGIREAMISKIPCIITKSVSLGGRVYEPEFYRHEEYAYLIPKKDPQALAEAVLKLLKNKKLRDKLAKNGPKFLKEFRFEKRIVINRTIELYNQALNLT